MDYGKAVQVLRDSGNSVTLSVRRRLLLPSQEPHILRVQLNKSRKKDGQYHESRVVSVVKISTPFWTAGHGTRQMNSNF